MNFKEYVTENTEIEDTEELDFSNGVYMAVKLSEESELVLKKYQTDYLAQFKDIELVEDFHCTLIHSTDPYYYEETQEITDCDIEKYSCEPTKKTFKNEIKTKHYRTTAIFKGFDLFGEDKNILVMKIFSPVLNARNEELITEYKFVSDFDEYTSHITLAYNVQNIDINSLPELNTDIILTDEYLEPLEPEKSEKN